MTKQEAIELAKTGWWTRTADDLIVSLQLFEEKLCMDFGAFHAAVERVLGRSVWTHEFADQKALQAEFLRAKPARTMREIIDMIPEAKRLVVVTE